MFNRIGKFLGRLLESQFLQTMFSKLDDGTFSDFVDDWKWIFSYSKKYKWIILFYLVLGLVGSTMGLASSVVSKYLIDIIVSKKIEKLWVLVGLMCFSTVFNLITGSALSRISTKISIYVNNDIQATIFDKIIDAQWSEINKYQNGDLLNRFNNDIGTVAGNAISWVPNLIISIYTFITTFIVVLYYDVTMAIIAFVSAPFLLVMSRFIMKKMREYRKRVLEMNSQMMSFETETFYNFDTIKSFGITPYYSKELRKWQEKYKEYNLDYNMFSIKSNIMLSILSTAVSFLAFGYCLFRLWTGSITYGTMTLFLQQRGNLSAQFNSLVGIIPGMLNSAISARRIRELVELPKEKHDPQVYEEVMKVANEGLTVKMDDVVYSYIEGQKVIKDSQFVAKPNEIVAIVGPSGGGKTTLLRLILGLIYPDTGDSYLLDCHGNHIEMNADLRYFFSYVPQGNTIISGTIADNLRMVKEDASDSEIIEALKIACAYDFVSEQEQGINSKIGEKGRGLSEGQAQRISIARAVLRNSPILLLDEATSALDSQTERQVLTNIIKQRPNKTIIVSTHRPSVLSMCQRIYRVNDHIVDEISYDDYKRMNEGLNDE